MPISHARDSSAVSQELLQSTHAESARECLVPLLAPGVLIELLHKASTERTPQESMRTRHG